MFISTFTLGRFTFMAYLSQRITSSAVSSLLTANIIMTVICESFCQLLSGKSKLSLNTEYFSLPKNGSDSLLRTGSPRCEEINLRLDKPFSFQVQQPSYNSIYQSYLIWLFYNTNVTGFPTVVLT